MFDTVTQPKDIIIFLHHMDKSSQFSLAKMIEKWMSHTRPLKPDS